MRRFAFTLEKMLNYKSSLYERERNELGRLRRERVELEQKLEAVQQQLHEKEVEFQQKAAHGVRMEEVQRIAYFRENSEKLVIALKEQIAAKEIEIEKQLAIVIQLDKDVKGLEKLKEKQWEEYVAESNREEKERILELVSFKYLETKNEEALEELAERQAEQAASL
ncbi:flagellar FliJ family protein [Ruminococcaceae bacterium OttesenSCG-928-I18]|nr:flagellar FliJ family protein [Ruminococcaceae bacterium OttesenSCG-928-I18]